MEGYTEGVTGRSEVESDPAGRVEPSLDTSTWAQKEDGLNTQAFQEDRRPEMWEGRGGMFVRGWLCFERQLEADGVGGVVVECLPTACSRHHKKASAHASLLPVSSGQKCMWRGWTKQTRPRGFKQESTLQDFISFFTSAFTITFFTDKYWTIC